MTETQETTARMRSTPVTTQGAELVTEQGKTTIGVGVVAKIASIAAREVPGVHELGARGAGGAFTSITQRVTGGDMQALGVKVEVGEREAAVDLSISVDYGVSIPQIADAVRRNIMGRIQSMTGLLVKEVNINVIDLYFPEEEAPSPPPERRVE